jgi:hypothetical protein
MNSRRDQELLAFVLGELGVLKRLDVRLHLLFSSAARRRLSELEQATSAVAGAIGAGGAAAFRANKHVKMRRLILVDLALVATMLASIFAGAFVIWRTNHPVADSCSVDTTVQADAPAPSKKQAKIVAQPLK